MHDRIDHAPVAPAPCRALTQLELPVTPLHEAGVRWLATHVAATRNARGQRLARGRFVTYVLGWFGRRAPCELTADGVREFRLALEHQWRLSPHTVAQVLGDLRCFLRWAAATGLIVASPFPARLVPRPTGVPARALEAAEVAVLSSLPGRPGFVLRFLLGTGLRWAEACRAGWGDVHGSMLVVAHAPSGRVRCVPLDAALLAEMQGRGRLVPYAARSPGSFSHAVERRTGIAGFHVHRCRSTFAARWLAAGGDLAVLQQVLGDRDTGAPLRAGATDDRVAREAARVAALLWPGRAQGMGASSSTRDR